MARKRSVKRVLNRKNRNTRKKRRGGRWFGMVNNIDPFFQPFEERFNNRPTNNAIRETESLQKLK